MKIINQSFEILASTPDLEKLIEQAGRVCWKSEERICEGSEKAFITSLRNKNHLSVFEHGSITVKIICDRGVSHELVRHRIASFSQESTRYCNYSKDKFEREVTFIDPYTVFPENGDEKKLKRDLWMKAMEWAENYYISLIKAGASPQEARSVLPNSLKTEIVMTANPREWMHIFDLRCSPQAHPQIREIIGMIKEEFLKRWPILFSEIS